MAWDWREDEMWACVCPKEVPIGDISYARHQTEPGTPGGTIEESRHATFWAKRKNTAWMTKTPDNPT